MIAPTPKTKADEILEDIGTYLSTAAHFLDYDDQPFYVKKWLKAANDLMKVDAALGSLVHAKINELHGNLQQIDYWHDNINKLGFRPCTLAGHRIVAYSNLGYASKGLQEFRNHVDISYGNIGQNLWLGIQTGAFQHMKHLINQANRGNIELPEKNVAIGQQIAELMAASGTTDDTCSAIMDVAGEVLRKHRLFWLGEQASYIINDLENLVLMRINVDVTYKDASDMTTEAAHILIEKNLDTAPFMIDFVGVRS